MSPLSAPIPARPGAGMPGVPVTSRSPSSSGSAR